MRLSKETKLEWLLEAFESNPHVDACSCLEAFRDRVDAYNSQEEQRIKALISHPRSHDRSTQI